MVNIILSKCSASKIEFAGILAKDLLDFYKVIAKDLTDELFSQI